MPSGTAWVGVGKTICIASPTKVAGWLIAPTVQVEATNTLDIAGASLLGSLHVASPEASTTALRSRRMAASLRARDGDSGRREGESRSNSA